MANKYYGCTCISLKYHYFCRKNLLIYEEIDIMTNEKSTLNSCNIGVLGRHFRRDER